MTNKTTGNAKSEYSGVMTTLSRRAKKTHTIDESGTKTICGEVVDMEKVTFDETRFRCEKCGN